jgi:prepilin-type processing-associated H-X9-DG protein
MHGALHGTIDGQGTRLSDIQDGTSKTIAIAEDVGRYQAMPGAYVDPIGGAKRAFWRWAEPDNGFGVSGDPTAVQNTPPPGGATGPNPSQYGVPVTPGVRAKVINNNKNPFGGPAGCVWVAKTNCGPNDEIFSFHTGGANVLFMDGHVSFLTENIDAIVMRRLVTASERISPNQNSAGAPIQIDVDY